MNLKEDDGTEKQGRQYRGRGFVDKFQGKDKEGEGPVILEDRK